MTTLVDGPARVARGAEFLDERHPGWAETIVQAADSLDMQDCGNCVLGTLFGSFETALKMFSMNGPPQYGFDVSPDDRRGPTRPKILDQYDELGKLWLAEARKRVAKECES